VDFPAGFADAPVPPVGVAGAGEPVDEAVGPVGTPDGEAAEPALSSPGWQAVMRSAADDTATIASAAPRTRDPWFVPYCMRSPDCSVQAPVAHRQSLLEIAQRPLRVRPRTGL
jgi:hypothetical protein